MPESAQYARRSFKGGARATTLAGAINDAVLSIGAADLSTWAGVTTNGPATATIDLGTTSEETIEFTGITGNTLTGVTRGVGGTTPRVHSDNAPIVHSSQVRDYDEANRLVSVMLGGNTNGGVWANWTPAISGNGAMTLTADAHVANHTRYVQHGKVIYVSYSQVFTFGGTLTASFRVSLPVAGAWARAVFSGDIQNGVARAIMADDAASILMARYDGAAFLAGSFHVSFHGFYEVA